MVEKEPSVSEGSQPGSVSALARTTRSRKRHNKVFSGCWTCRAKHIKCDEAKPTCARCGRSGIRCEGYGIRLSWPSQHEDSVSSSSKASSTSTRLPRTWRRRGTETLAARSPQPVLDEGDSLAPAARDDEQTMHQDPLTTVPSPFSGLEATAPAGPSLPPNFVASPTNVPPVQWSTHRDPSSPAWDDSTTTQKLLQNRQQGQQHRITEAGKRGTSADRSARAPLPPGQRTITLGVNANNPYADISWLPNHQGTAAALSSHAFGSVPSTASQARQKRPLRHLDTLSDHANRCRLLEHWDQHVCDALNPMPGICNPVRTIFTPLALEGAREDAATSTGAVALFHLICSAAGFHLSKSEETSESRYTFESLALEHHNLGLTHLSQNIQSDDENQYVSILASLIMCLLNEAITAYDPFWRLHIQGAVEWVNHVGLEYWHHDESASTTYQMYMCMGVLIQAQILPGDRSGYGWDLRFDPASLPGPYVGDSILGVPQHVLEAIHTMNRIQQRAQREQKSPADSSPHDDQDTPHDLDALEFELLLMVPRKPKSCEMDHDYGRLKYHYGYIYYYSALIYLRRTIKKDSVESVQGLVKPALAHFEALQTASDVVCSPALWPTANIAFEAQEPQSQLRMLSCLESLSQRSQLTIWDKFASSVRGLWERRRNEGDEDLSWYAYSSVFYHNYIFI